MTLTGAGLEPPKAKIVPKTIELHGDHRNDEYFWLRERDNPEVRAYLEAENRYTEARMKDTETLQKKLYEEIVGRIQEDDVSAPVHRGDYLYYTVTKKGLQYQINCRRKGPSGAEEVLLDSNELAKGHSYFVLGGFSPSPNQKILAYATDTKGDEKLTVRFKDLATGKLLEDSIEGAYYGLEWSEDNRTIFYTILDHAHRPYKVLRHRLGTKQSEDVEVYHEKDERFTVSLGKTRSKAYIVVSLNSAATSEALVIDARKPDSAPQTVIPRKQDVEYGLTHRGGSFYVWINDTGRNFRLVEIPVSSRDPKDWKELIAHRPAVTIEDAEAYAGHLVVTEREKGLRKLRIRRFRDSAEHFVEMPEPVYTLAGNTDEPYDTKSMRFVYASLTTPASSYDYDMETRTRILVKRQPVLGGYDPANYVAERLEAAAADGVRIPVSIVYRKGLKKDGSAPALLYGYGSYGAPSEPGFASDRLSLLDRGFVYAIAHVRGGGDLGKTWHDDGKLQKKRNTFTDFIAAAELLIKSGYTNPKMLGIAGGSAGGLLMGAVVNMRPDLFGAVIAKVPFVDVISTMMDKSLPLTIGEYEEWGNPADEAAYRYMRSYSPYDNVERQSFPNMLVTAGLNDPRVSYWEPAKWVARLRTVKKDANLLLLKTNMGAGHFGASGRYERYKETAFDYAFLFKALGIAAE
ncbi:MAG: S9 family peptidase [Bryobacteraceae bacterium]|nr:S9 family peptidase [Bryobacteraceae bacterium]